MEFQNLLIIGGTGYLGRNFSLICDKNRISNTIIDLRGISKFDIKEFSFVIDFSMINRDLLPWGNEIIQQYKINHNYLINMIQLQNVKYIRISSIFDIRKFIRNDSYTTLSRDTSRNVLNKIPSKAAVVYCHAIYGGVNSTSFIDNGVLLKQYTQESIRDYVHIKDFNLQILDLISNKSREFNQIELGTAIPYLSSTIKKYVSKEFSIKLSPELPTSQVFKKLVSHNLVCSAIQPSISGVKKILVKDNLPTYEFKNYQSD